MFSSKSIRRGMRVLMLCSNSFPITVHAGFCFLPRNDVQSVTVIPFSVVCKVEQRLFQVRLVAERLSSHNHCQNTLILMLSFMLDVEKEATKCQKYSEISPR